MVAGTALVVIAGQIAIPLPFTPIPLSLGTLAVLLIGATLGPIWGSSSIVIYLVLGVAGTPIFAEHRSGWAFASFGYIVGYLAATAIVGHLARRRADRSIVGTVGLAALGSLAIYACGVPWLMAFAHVGFPTAVTLGVLPFLVGDTIKVVATSFVLPTTWRVLGRDQPRDR